MSVKAKILLVDDDPDIQEFMTYNLEKSGYEVSNAYNGDEAIILAESNQPDLIILDIMMPGKDGIQVCEILRTKEDLKDVIVTFLTARGEDYSQIAGFDAGADDYITKPIQPNVFLKKIDALLRRANKIAEPKAVKTFESDFLKINFETRDVSVNGENIQLAKKEFLLLKLLVSDPGKVFTRDEIYNNVWGSDVVVGDRTIDVHIRKLREKIGGEYITTLKGVGYKLSI
ncbi:MAG: DNA-binding response regulator [Marinilabiliales bacterium]|nr:MAG: DNA-binding response regulator [Marinilabiliales bacterium]